jgi:hypothetical protein
MSPVDPAVCRCDVICVCFDAGYRDRPMQPGKPIMHIRRIAISAAFAAGLAALPLGAAKAQYYPPCSPFPLSWPFCVVGAVVGTAATIATAPFRALTPPPYYYGYPYSYRPAYGYPGWRYRRWCWYHPYRCGG